jgi:hypothetical protein
MGLLDDAIKEHLELKRKHGAPEEEVQRQEEEALGPVRRDAAEQPESAGEEVVEAEDGDLPAAEEAPATDANGEVLFEGEEPFPAEEEPFPPEAEPVPADEEPVPADEEPVPADEEPVPEAEPDRRAPDPDATQEYDPFADEERADEGAEPAAEREQEEDGDVLEDTPDFLQETPEHDRLWFEQKPPRDFDFD